MTRALHRWSVVLVIGGFVAGHEPGHRVAARRASPVVRASPPV